MPKTELTVAGFKIKRRVIFMNRWIKHGGLCPPNPMYLAYRQRQTEGRWTDEHFIGLRKHDSVSFHGRHGRSQPYGFYIIDKHSSYASKELLGLLAIENKMAPGQNTEVSLSGEQYSRKR